MAKFLDMEATDKSLINGEESSSSLSESEMESIDDLSKKRRATFSDSDSEASGNVEHGRKNTSKIFCNKAAVSEGNEVLKEVRRSNFLLKTLVKRISKAEKLLKLQCIRIPLFPALVAE